MWATILNHRKMANVKTRSSKIFWNNAIIVIATLCLATAVCGTITSCSPYKAYLHEKAKNHPTRTIAYWGHAWKEKPLTERVMAAPEDLMEKIRLENRLEGFTERPVSVDPTPEFYKAIKRIIDLLPEKVRGLSEERIIGIFIVRDLGGSGYGEMVVNEEGKEHFAVIVLDRDALLTRKANGWATWKENSVFRTVPGGKRELRVIIESTGNDDTIGAIEYILLHEMGHILGMASGVHASWNEPAVVSHIYPFTLLSWKMEGDTVTSLFDGCFSERKFIQPYAFEKSAFSLTQANDVYRKIFNSTNFPTIHASVNPWEDFAESFVNYFHVIHENKPYEIHLKKEGTPDSIFHSCWNQNACETKKEFLRKWFENPTRP
jgi:hypothetical protein